MATLRRLLQQLSRLAHVNVDHLGAHTGFLRPASCDEFITADHLSGFSSHVAQQLELDRPKRNFPRCCKHGGIELHLDVAICQWSALLRQFRDGSPIASLRRWSRSYCGANGLMKRSSTRAATACADLQRLGISRRHRAGNWSGHPASAGRSPSPAHCLADSPAQFPRTGLFAARPSASSIERASLLPKPSTCRMWPRSR